ncbi:MAG: adenylate/guanylate cyclase domain-containing protein [Oscillospiraceae bacterium]
MKHRFKHFAFAAIYALVCALCGYFNLFYTANNILCDAMYQQPDVLDGKTVVLGIDERAVKLLGPYSEWTRSDMANIINKLNSNLDARPDVIGIDVMYIGETNEKADIDLANAAANGGNVVVASNIKFKHIIDIFENGDFGINKLGVDLYEEPYPLLKNVVRVGHTNTMPDKDGVIRTSIHKVALPDGRVSNSFASEVYMQYAKHNGLDAVAAPPLNSRNQWYIPFSAMPGDFSDGYSVADVLNGTIPSEAFADAIVLIGPYAAGMQDAYVTAINHAEPMYGVEIHANIISAMINKNYKVYLPVLIETIIYFITMFGAYFAFKKLEPKLSALVALLIVSVYIGAAYILSFFGVIVELIYLPMGIILLFFAWLSINYITENLEKKKITDTFKRYVAPTVVDEIFNNKNSIKLGGSKREISCMFVDIRGFTPMSEALLPEKVVEILNEYLSLTSRAIFAHEGMVDKFIGDATMALFNAPIDLDDYVYRSVLAAWDIAKSSAALKDRLMQKHACNVTFGIGLNCGAAVVGNIGTDARMDYTAIGDTVNIASRLESQAKSGQVLLSENVYNAVKDRITVNTIGEMSLKGKTKGVMVYELTGVIGYEAKHLI